MAFDVPKMYKFEDHIEDQATDYAINVVEDFYGVEDFNDLTQEQIEEIRIFAEYDDRNFYTNTAMGLRNVISMWENQ